MSKRRTRNICNLSGPAGNIHARRLWRNGIGWVLQLRGRPEAIRALLPHRKFRTTASRQLTIRPDPPVRLIAHWEPWYESQAQHFHIRWIDGFSRFATGILVGRPEPVQQPTPSPPPA